MWPETIHADARATQERGLPLGCTAYGAEGSPAHASKDRVDGRHQLPKNVADPRILSRRVLCHRARVGERLASSGERRVPIANGHDARVAVADVRISTDRGHVRPRQLECVLVARDDGSRGPVLPVGVPATRFRAVQLRSPAGDLAAARWSSAPARQARNLFEASITYWRSDSRRAQSWVLRENAEKGTVPDICSAAAAGSRQVQPWARKVVRVRYRSPSAMCRSWLYAAET